jgi:hypothetical protein
MSEQSQGDLEAAESDRVTFGGKYDGQDDFRSEQEARLEPGSFASELEAFRSETDGKMVLGDQKYGPDSWQRHDQLAEAMSELVDLANYAFLKWRQLRALQVRLDDLGLPHSLTGEDRLGVQPPVLEPSEVAAPAGHVHAPSAYSVCPVCRGLQWEIDKEEKGG